MKLRTKRPLIVLSRGFDWIFVFFCGLLVTLGCSDRTLENDVDANVLAPSTDIRFQGLPLLEGGYLTPGEDIPRVSLQMIREDAETIWCQLIAEPPPTREDLVVGIERGSYWNEFPADVHLSVSQRLSLYVIPRHAEKSKEIERWLLNKSHKSVKTYNSLKQTADEILFSELKRRGYNLLKLRDNGKTAEIIKTSESKPPVIYQGDTDSLS